MVREAAANYLMSKDHKVIVDSRPSMSQWFYDTGLVWREFRHRLDSGGFGGTRKRGPEEVANEDTLWERDIVMMERLWLFHTGGE